MPARRVGGRWRVASVALDAFIEQADRASEAASDVVVLRTLFIANRGEIAGRIRRTAERLGLRVVVPPTDDPGGLDLLDIGTVVAAAHATGADALHPGFGFLAENPDFAAAVAAAGLRWVGPPPEAIRTMGDKAAARRLAARLGVPIVPGYDGADQTDQAIARAGRRIGYPLIVKPAAGGGGKGMRVVRAPEGLADALAAARREAVAAFGDDRLILERLVEGARHVEVQVLCDAHGAGVHLGERDCSIQRRNQKVLEETPSPGVDDEMRRQLGSWALRLAAAVGYESAGTCEFLVDDHGEARFLEMNTRLQVEHPVTEAVTGRDLVADQLAIAAGARLADLGLTQTALDRARAAGGHAVEVRLYAEDADDGFLPAIGRILALRWPSGDGIRVDAGITEGDDVSGRFDPMLAKLIAHGAIRDEALERLGRALGETLVLGLTTNLRFLRWLVRQPVVRDGAARVDTLGRIWPPDGWADTTAIPEAAWAAAAAALLPAGPWAGGWRMNGAPTVALATETERRRVPARTAPDGPLVARAGDEVHVDVGGRSVAFRLAPPPDVDRAARAAAHHGIAGPVEVRAPMPGGVLTVHVVAGAEVEAGDPVLTLEAMKMEHLVLAPIAGTVAELFARPADQVARGSVLAVIEP